jgi:hypothetical protein
MQQPQECPKCHHVRRPNDTTPPWQCPHCGIAYDKFAVKTPVGDIATRREDAASNKAKGGNRFKTIRIIILTAILILVGTDTLLTKLRTTSWDHTLRVVVYPINGDGSEAAASFIAGLNEAQFDPIEQLTKAQALRYGITLDQPIDIALANPVADIPPLPPRDSDPIKVIWWSLKLRLWAFQRDHYDGPTPEVRAFTLYYDPKTHPVLEHSTGLEKGMIGVIKLFASPQMAQQNNMVMLHELLHTLGATDKYDLGTDQPLYPDGYAEPDLQPRLPQRKAEIMAGRIPLTDHHAEIPDNLADVVVGPETAREIGWIKK